MLLPVSTVDLLQIIQLTSSSEFLSMTGSFVLWTLRTLMQLFNISQACLKSLMAPWIIMLGSKFIVIFPLTPYSLIKLVTSPAYFNVFNWTKQIRSLLQQILTCIFNPIWDLMTYLFHRAFLTAKQWAA